MLKKYLPYILLLVAALSLWFIKKNQRGAKPVKPATEQTENKITVSAVIPTNDGQNTVAELNRHSTHIIYSKHAICRMDCRHIDESEVKEILENGQINYSRIEEDEKGKSYPLEGITHDKQRVRIVFAPKRDALVVVTVIDLDRDWACDCNTPFP